MMNDLTLQFEAMRKNTKVPQTSEILSAIRQRMAPFSLTPSTMFISKCSNFPASHPPPPHSPSPPLHNQAEDVLCLQLAESAEHFR